MRIAGIDTETTGIDFQKGHRLIEVGINMYDWEPGREPVKKGKTWTQRIQPNRAIDPDAQAVHHISAADLKGAPVFEDVAPTIYKLISAADLLVAHNVDFDAPFVAFEFVKAGLEPPDVETFCTLENGRFATPMGTVPNLGALCWALDVDYNPDEAHAADYDIDKTMDCFFEGLRRGHFEIPRDVLQKAA